MRAKEFTINLPIKIVATTTPSNFLEPVDVDNELLGIDKLLDLETDTPIDKSSDEDKSLATNFIPPLQQKIELMKQAGGKHSKVIDQLVADEDEPGT
jgi:hypothetical protein